MIDLKSLFNNASGNLKEFLLSVRNDINVSAFGLHFGNRTCLAAAFPEFVYVCADYVAANKAFEQISCLRSDAVLLPPKSDVLTYAKMRSGENSFRRLSALGKIASGECKAVITTADALVGLFPHRESFLSRTLYLVRGKEYNMSRVAASLVAAGYSREDQVLSRGHFSMRGDIIDVFPPNTEKGVRLEFFGDELETLKYFDVSEQTTVESADSVCIIPCGEVFLSEEEKPAILRSLEVSKKLPDEFRSRAENIVSDLTVKIESGTSCESLEFIQPLVKHSAFFEFVRPEKIFFDDAKQVVDMVNMLYTEHANRFKTLFARGDAFDFSLNSLTPKEKVFDFPCNLIAFHKLTSANRIFSPQAVYNFDSFEIPSYVRNFAGLCDDLNAWLSRGYRIVLFCGSDKVAANMNDFLAENRVGSDTGGAGEIIVSEKRLDAGAAFHDCKTVLIGTYNLINKIPKKVIKRNKSDVFVQPGVNDYVVHNVHGIGFCEKVDRLTVGGASRDYFVIRYKGGDKLYVPIENMDSLTKYVSGESEPELSKIGGAEFSRMKEKVRSSVKKMAVDLLDLYARRSEAKGHKYSSDDAFLYEFCDAFPFTETEDQLQAVTDGLNDLHQGKIMDRLLCGDVGYGKTEVALRLAFKVISEGKQVAFVSPTTILARQHFATVKNRMESFGVRVGSLTRFDSASEAKKTIEKLIAGELDIVVGTHRALSKDVAFKDLGLLILDEEQRFGVADKEKIKRLKVNVNVLTLSATPIPRTLHMSMIGIRDISVLDTPPAMRIPVQTYVTEYTESLLSDAVTREINRGGQVFIVYNRVETIDKFAASVKAVLPDVRLAVAHGQMTEEKLERIINGFICGEVDVLISTAIIENGIDMPNANTMIVMDSDRFGLSQLYQLRGRVGRSDRLAYVYFTFDGRKLLTETAYKRLDAITEYTEFGSGFRIAMRDLEIRGAGNVLGREQHGHIEKVGYDTYCKLLEEAVKELSGSGEFEELQEVKVNTDFNAFIPESYIADGDWRMRVYSRISRIETNAERLSLIKDLEDIYGKIPPPADNLILIALVKNLAAKIGASSVTLKKDECSVNFAKTHSIPASAAALAGARFKAMQSRIDFGASRAEMIKFLIDCRKNHV